MQKRVLRMFVNTIWLAADYKSSEEFLWEFSLYHRTAFWVTRRRMQEENLYWFFCQRRRFGRAGALLVALSGCEGKRALKNLEKIEFRFCTVANNFRKSFSLFAQSIRPFFRRPLFSLSVNVEQVNWNNELKFTKQKALQNVDRYQYQVTENCFSVNCLTFFCLTF